MALIMVAEQYVSSTSSWRRRIVEQVKKITFEKDVDLRIEMAVMEQLGNSVFTQAAAVDHFNDHAIGMEKDHLSALTRCVVRAYLAVRIKTCMRNVTAR